ncbi:Remorin [Forsythia ovata]|uniref:Remorin n=1 Tax=Forsythia ovata TaxID=205694 RepID=A0ABD1WA65_9LAMI
MDEVVVEVVRRVVALTLDLVVKYVGQGHMANDCWFKDDFQPAVLRPLQNGSNCKSIQEFKNLSLRLFRFIRACRVDMTIVEVERMRARAQDKLMNKLATVRHKAEEKLAAAEAKRNCHAAKTEEQAEYIRKTGRIPSSFSCRCWCF